MTKITNKYGYPETLVRAVTHDGHITNGDISATTLIDAPQIRYLTKKHYDESEKDVSEMIWALMGTAMHAVLERSNVQNKRREAFMEVISTLKELYARGLADQLKEGETQKDADDAKKVFTWLLNFMFRFFPELDERYMFEANFQLESCGWKISCTLDLYDKIDKKLMDYKFTGTFSYTSDDTKTKWQQQANIYARALRSHGYEVVSAEIIAIFKDWSKMEMLRKPGYPKRQVIAIPITIWDNETIDRYVAERVKLHQRADKGDVVPCTGTERWASSNYYAVKQKDGKRAESGSVSDSRAAAEKFIRDNQHKYKKELYVEERPGTWRRCEGYCNVSEFCPQFAEYKKLLSSDQVDSDSGWEKA